MTGLLEQAAAWLRVGRPDAASGALQQAVLLAPGHAGIWHDLGLAWLSCGLFAEAAGALRRSIELDPSLADSHLRLGIALEALGAVQEALAAYERAVAIAPGLADASFRAGDLLNSLGRAQAAIAAYRAAAASAPLTTLGRIARAKALLAGNRHTEAEVVLRETLASDSGNAVALDLLGALLSESGRFVEAADALEQAIARSPACAGSYYEVARCRTLGPQDGALIGRMRAALALPGLEPMQRSRVHLALGKAAADLGDFQSAMRQFDSAEALRNAVVRFDLTAFEARVERLIAQPVRTNGNDSARPVLIVGLPRSGTTLIEQILSAHPDVAAGGELGFWNECGAAWQRCGGAPAADAYLAVLREVDATAARVTDKMPLNFQWAGLIHAAFPHATIIHCRRSLIDTALSIHQTHFNPRIAFPTGGPDLVGYVRGYQRLMAHWRAVLPAERFIEVCYETLTEAPETEIRRLVACCGLEWDPACLHPERNGRVVRTPSKWQARQPIYRTGVGRWRHYAPFLGALGALAVDAKPAPNY